MGQALIIGGGAAGLAVSSCLSRLGIENSLVEAGATLLSSLNCLDPTLRLLSPTALSELPNIGLPPSSSTYLSFAELVVWLSDYAVKEKVCATLDTRVVKTEALDEGFRVTCRKSDGEQVVHSARWLVNCTGIIGSPKLPENFLSSSCDLPWCHTKDLRAKHYLGREAPLIVGAGTSANEAYLLWKRSGAPGKMTVCAASIPRAVPRRLFSLDLHYFGWFPEMLPSSLPGVRTVCRKDPTIGLELSRALSRGEIRLISRDVSYEKDHVLLANGERLETDALIFATGYEYRLSHLSGLVKADADGIPLLRACESATSRGLFCIGARLGRTVASPYLRGIARDAQHVANMISRRMNKSIQ